MVVRNSATVLEPMRIRKLNPLLPLHNVFPRKVHVASQSGQDDGEPMGKRRYCWKNVATSYPCSIEQAIGQMTKYFTLATDIFIELEGHQVKLGQAEGVPSLFRRDGRLQYKDLMLQTAIT